MNTEKNSPERDEEMDANVTPEERALLDESIDNGLSDEHNNISRSMLDSTDEDGELLQGASTGVDFSGDELDIPGAELDDDNELLGEEDEENNGYSQADTE